MQQEQMVKYVLYREELKEEWENFIENAAINGTFLHSRKFFDHNPSNAFDDSSLLFYKENKIVAVFPAVIYNSDGNVILHSHSRATCGGFVVGKKTGVGEAIDIVEQTIAFAKFRGVQQIIIRNPLRIYHTKLCDETDYAMWYHGFKIKSRELETAVQLAGDIDQVRSHYHKGAKYSVGKARRSITVTLSNDFRRFWTLLERCLAERHGKKPVHDYRSICTLRDQVGSENILLFAAYYNNKMIGGNLVFNFDNRVLYGQYNAADKEYQHLSPLHALVDYILEWSTSKGFKYFNMGTSNENEGRDLNIGLANYKESYGARNFLRETMYLNIKDQVGYMLSGVLAMF